MELEYKPFCVYKKKYVVAYWNLIEENRKFIESFDPVYFSYLADHHCDLASSDKGHNEYHATQLRMLYSQALESFFAFMFGIMQAPLCLVAWLQKYTPADLRNLIRIVSERKNFPFFKWDIGHICWFGIAKFITPVNSDNRNRNDMIEDTETLIESLSKDYLNRTYSIEYNSLKHGFRARLGGFKLLIGKDKDTMSVLGESAFGSSFMRIDEIKELTGDEKNSVFTLRRTNVNWDPEYFRRRISLMKNLFSNMSNMVKVIYGTKNSELEYWTCDDDSELRNHLRNRTGVQTFDMDKIVHKTQIGNMSEQVNYDDFYKEKYCFVEECTT